MDDEGLNLKISKGEDDLWYCDEVFSEERFGYGKYTFYLDGQPDTLDKNAVLGLFTYFEELNDGNDIIEPEKGEGEIDIEFTKQIPNWWKNDPGVRSDHNSHYALQPTNENVEPRDHFTFQTTLKGKYSTHYFNWKRSSVHFKSMHGHYEDTNDVKIALHGNYN